MRALPVLSATLLITASIAQQATDPTVFQSQAREVLLEVVVRDAHGKLVTKVDPSQVTVYEDGVRQDIKSFRLIPGREARAEYDKQIAQPAAATDSAPVPAPTPARRQVSNPLRTVNVVCLILNDINPETRAFAFTAAKKFVDKELRPDTYIGVFTLDARGLRPVFPFSNSREHLIKAIELASVNQLATIAQSSAAVLNGLSLSTLGVSLSSSVSTAIVAAAGQPPPLSVTAPPPAGVPTAPDGSSLQDPLGARGDMGVSVNAGLREIDALIGLVKQLGQLPFQKTVLLMSTGLTRPPDQLEYWKSLIANANKGGVTFYGLDVYGLGVCQDQPTCPEGTNSTQGGSPAIQGSPVSTPTSASVALMQSTAGMSSSQSTVGLGRTDAYKSGGSSTQGPSPAAQTMESMHQTDYLRFAVLSANQQEALREISESTGGFVIANTNNSEALLTKVMEEVDTHYELAYQPASPSADGHFRKIEVKLNKPDLRVETRKGYYAVPETGEGPLQPGDMGALAALDTTPLPFDFGFETRAYRFRSAKGTAQYSIAWEIPIANLTATPEQQKKHRFHAYLFALVKNAQGDIVDRVSKDVPSDVADNYLAGLRSETMIYEHAVNLPPGRYTVETVVIDQEGNRRATSVFPVDNREQPGPGVSDIALVRRVHEIKRPFDPADPFEVPGKRAQPFLSTELPAGTQPYIYFVVYPEPDTLETPLLQAQFLKDGRVLATQRSALPAADNTGAIPMAMQTAAAPGDYEVKLTVEQGQKSAQRSLKYSIAAK